MPHSDTVICVPARWAARRLPGKLARIWRGRPVLSWAISAAIEADLGEVVLLADDERLLTIGRDLGVRSELLDAPARNGSERIAAALDAGLLGAPDRVVNVQGDAVGVTTEAIQSAAGLLRWGLPLATVAVPTDAADHGRTTVQVEAAHPCARAVAFSREPRWPHLHVGVYAYDPAVLRRIAALPPGAEESRVSLEQLRWLEHGHDVAIEVLDAPASVADAVDAATDLA